MKDAFGGAFMIRLFLVFIFIYMFFTAIALNYAKAFKVKNKVIEYLQDNEVATIKKGDITAANFKTMSDYFEKEILGPYNYRISNNEMHCGKDAVYCDSGIEIYQIDAKIQESNRLGVYYRVNTYFKWSAPFIRTLMTFGNDQDSQTGKGIWKISGETRTIASE